MRRLNVNEIEEMAVALELSTQETEEIAEIFYTEKEQGNYRLNRTKLNTVKDYIYEWECNWYSYSTWEQLLESEAEQNEGYTEEQCEELLGSAIFRLATGMYIQTVG